MIRLLSIALLVHFAAGQLPTVQRAQWDYVFPPPGSTQTSKSYAAATVNGSTLLVVGGEAASGTSTLPTGLVDLVSKTIMQEQLPTGLSYRATRAAAATVEVPVTSVFTATAPIGSGAYMAAFGGLNAAGSVVNTFAKYNTNNSWSTIATSGTAPSARQGASMTYLHNCQNKTGCFVVHGGSSATGTTLFSDAFINWPDIGLPSSTTVCGTGPENGVLPLQCPPNTYITSIPFSSYGTPGGSCGAYTIVPACHAANSMAAALPCLGQNLCNININNIIFGDPCYGTTKRMYAQVVCTPLVGWQSITPKGTPPSARSQASLTASYDGRYAYMFGGKVAAGVSSDLFVLASSAGLDDALPNTELTNLALGMPAYSGSVDQSNLAMPTLATSGSINTAFKSGTVTTCAQTTVQTNPWWVVDLGSVQNIASVTIYQRTDVSTGMLAGFRIYVGTRNTTWDDTSNVMCANPYTDVQGSSATVPCTASGRFVWVMVPGSSRQLALCQVQVWGRIPWIWRQLSGTAEVAQGKSTWQSSTYSNSPGGDPARAVDGITNNGQFGTQPYTCTHTSTADATHPAAWMVDLGDVYDVTSLTVFPRLDCCTTRNLRWNIYVGSSKDYNFNTKCANVPSDVTPVSPATSISINCAARGRYVIVMRPYLAGDENLLSICELKVYANLLSNQPPARSGHAATAYRGHVVVFGGVDANGFRLNDVRLFDTVASKWIETPVILGSSPSARAFTVLTAVSSSQLMLYGGSSNTDPLNDLYTLTFPSCPSFITTGIASAQCYYGQTVCFFTCSSGFLSSNGDAPLVCGLDGTWNGITPPCAGVPPSAPQSIVAFTGVSSATVTWSAPSFTNTFPTIINYKVLATPGTYQFSGFVAGVTPSDWPNWVFNDPLGGQYYSFMNGAVTILSQGAGNCWGAQQSCPMAYRAWPANIPLDNFAVETFAIIDVTTVLTTGSTVSCVGIFDTSRGFVQFYLCVMKLTSSYAILWEHSYNLWSQQVALSATQLPQAFLRIVRIGTTWKGQYKFNAGDAWSTFPYVPSDTNLYNNVAIPPASIRAGLVVKNWSGKAATHYFNYMTISSTVCAATGSVRTVPGTVTSTVVSGLSPTVQYSFQVVAATAAGYGTWSGSSNAVTILSPAAPVVLPTINVALNKPTSQSATLSTAVSSNAVDGNLQTIGGTTPYKCVDTGIGQNNWWQVDFLTSADVQSMRLYGRSDCCQTRSTNLMIYIGDSTDWRQNTQCNVATNIPAAPWYQDLTCVLTGRYLTIISPYLSDSLNFCELIVNAANQCPNRVTPNASPIGSSVCTGAVLGSVCQLACDNGYVAISGTSASTCRGASWDQPDLVCSPTCPDLVAPANYGDCTQSLFSESFSNSTSLYRFASLTPSTSPLGTAWLVADGSLQAAAALGCTTDLKVTALSNQVYNYQSKFTLSVLVNTATSAGLLFKVTNAQNYYRFAINVATGVHLLERVVAGVPTTLIDAKMSLRANTWYTLTVTYLNGQMNCSVNSTLLLSTSDSTLVLGYAGLYSYTTSFFQSFMFVVPCTTCSGTTPGEWCQYTCASGFLASNNGTSICQSRNAVWTGASPVCTLPSPVFYNTQRSIAEDSEVNAQVGSPLVGSSSSPTSQVLYKISSGNNNTAFWIDACSGQMRVKTAILDYTVQPVYVLGVTAYIAGFEATSYTTANVTVYLIAVPKPPVITPASFVVLEGSGPATFIGTATFTAHLPMNVTWAWSIDSSNGVLAINSTTGKITVASTATTSSLKYYASPNSFNNLALATSVEYPTLSSTGSITISVGEINLAPALQPPSQDLSIGEVEAITNAVVGTVTAFKRNTATSPFASNISFAIVGGSTGAALCPINTSSTPRLQYPTSTGIATTGSALFRIDSTNGTLFLQNVDQVNGGGFDPWRLNAFFSYNSVFARAAYSVCVNTSDKFGAWTVAPVQVLITAAVPAQPQITSMTGAVVMATTGGENITFSGQHFGNPGAVRVFAWYSNGRRTYNASVCVVLSDTDLTCTTVPGSGVDLIWTVWLDQGPVSASLSLITAYGPPTILSLTGTQNIFTAVPQLVTFQGLNFGPPGTPIVVSYGATFQFPCTYQANASDSHFAIRCLTTLGSGSQLPWKLSVDGQVVLSDQTSVQFSYAAPIISNITVISESIKALDPSGGADIRFSGVNFGEPAATIAVTFGGPSGTLKAFAGCYQFAPTVIRCLTVSGVGTNLPVSLVVSGVVAAGATSGNASAAQGISYAAPIITQVGGVGAVGGTTAGGQQVLIYGQNFGPITYPVDTVTYAVYGHPANLGYTAVSCRVIQEPPQQCVISCLTAPGVGASLAWQIAVGGQASNTLLAASSYGAPVVTSFSGPGAADALTPGGQVVRIGGANFGPVTLPTALLKVSYSVVLNDGPLDTIEYNATNCFVSVDHVELQCNTDTGAGAALVWRVYVDGQLSAQPTTWYARPAVTSITDALGFPVTAASVDGGTVLLIKGTNFGPTSLFSGPLNLLQGVAFGSSGSEYKIAVGNFTLLAADTIRVVLPPGCGSNLVVRVEVGDQFSDVSTSTFSYAAPAIIDMFPRSWPTGQAGTVTLTTRNLPLLDVQSRIFVFMGSVSVFAIMTPVLPPSRSVNSDVNISFSLPTTLAGANLPVRILVQPSTFASPSLASASALSAVTAANFSYMAPRIDSIVVVRPRFVEANSSSTDNFAVVCPPTLPWSCADPSLLMVVISGASFGGDPNKLSGPDGVTRKIETILAFNIWTTSNLALYSWSHTQIVGFTMRVQDTVRITLTSSYTGVAIDQSVNQTYASLSPSISDLVGFSGPFNTIGGQKINVVMDNLQGATSFKISIGGNPCRLQDGNGVDVTNSTTALINAAVTNWNVTVVIPAGQGTGNPIIITRYDGASPQVSDPGWTVDYIAPSITQVDVLGGDPNLAATAWASFPIDPLIGGVVQCPTPGTWMRVYGTNLGTGPSIVLGDGFTIPSGQVTACGASQSCYQFYAPAGEGTGLQAENGGIYAPYGYRLIVRGGNIDSQYALLRYLPAKVTSMSGAAGFPTQGQVIIALRGENFGTTTTGRPAGYIGVQFQRQSDNTYLTCGSPIRMNDTYMTCILPQGSGVGLSAIITVGDVTGTTLNILTYDKPVVTSAFTTLMTAPPSTTNLYSAHSFLRGTSSGGTNVTLVGRNFGQKNAGHCVFLTWANRPLASASLVCNQQEDFIGEGEIPAANILSWTHTQIVFRTQPGLGVKDVEFDVMGNHLDTARTGPPSASLWRFQYSDPVVSVIAPPTAPTVGDTQLTISGLNFGPSLVTNNAVAFPADMQLATSVPTVSIRVSFNGVCISNTSTDCFSTVVYQGQTQVVIKVPAGVGKNKNVSIAIVDGYASSPYVFEQQSNNVMFSYDAPRILSISPNLLPMDDGKTGFAVTLTGQNFGDPTQADAQSWTAEERVLAASIDIWTCPQMNAVKDSNGVTRIACTVNASVPVGVHGMNLLVAGQATSVSASDAVSLEVACKNGYYGHVNETCFPCPSRGALCPGVRTELTLASMRYPYPIPQPGFFNLNGSMAFSCPDGFQVPGRDVCIVACANPDSCLEDNFCAEGYESRTPHFRCSSCLNGYYPSANQCVKCPDSPYALIIGFILLVLAAGAIGFFLNKKGINLAFVSIGVDFMQVLAMFANAKIQWPASVKQLFRILSAFNLNIEIVAPECIVPDVSFKQKFYFVMLLPLSIGTLFIIVQAATFFHKVVCMRRRRSEVIKHMGGLVSAFLVLFYILYMYLTKTIFDIFNCTPLPNLPDGKTYLQVVFEPCGVPGGTQMTLLPYAIIGLCVYTAGYPIFLSYKLWSNKALIMEDQLLRAKGVGDDRLTNPNAYDLRRRYGRTYYQFKPDTCMWILVIVIRKFSIAICSLMFQKNSAFQMSACLLVLFVAYALQVRFLPYMSPGDMEDVLKKHQESSFTNATHARLRAALANVESRGKKRLRMNILTFDGKVDRSAVLGVLAGWIFNYNTVEGLLLFAGVIVCLCAVMYEAVSNGASYYSYNADGITTVVMMTICIALVYYFSCVITEVVILVNEKSRAQALSKSRTARKSVASTSKLADQVALRNGDEPNIGKVDSSVNPMFMRGETMLMASTADAALDAINSMKTSPPTELWTVFQSQYADMHNKLKQLTAELTSSKTELQRGSGGNGDEDPLRSPQAAVRRKSEFQPQLMAAEHQSVNPLIKGRRTPSGSSTRAPKPSFSAARSKRTPFSSSPQPEERASASSRASPADSPIVKPDDTDKLL